MAENSIEEIIRKYISELKLSGFPVEKVVLFGSCSKGNCHSSSDIDLIVVSPVFDSNFTRDDILKLWEAASKVDSRIEPVHCGSKQWTSDDGSAIIEIARREGTAISAA